MASQAQRADWPDRVLAARTGPPVIGGIGPILIAALLGASPPPSEVPVVTCHITIFEKILALRPSFPHLAGLNSSHIDGGYLQFEQGRSMVPNDNYEAQLAAWEAEQARQAAEDAKTTLRRKRHHIPPPGKEVMVWDQDSLFLSMSLRPTGPNRDRHVSAAASVPQPGYEAIELQWSVSGSYSARLPGCDVSLNIEGEGIDGLRTALFDILLGQAAPSSE